jgi:hypothetical protein
LAGTDPQGPSVIHSNPTGLVPSAVNGLCILKNALRICGDFKEFDKL